jgi:PAS domain S-box-containing protein
MATSTPKGDSRAERKRTSRSTRREPGTAPLSLLAPTEYEAMFEVCPDAIAVFDAEGRLLAANAAFGHLVGYARHELLAATGERESPGARLHQEMFSHAPKERGERIAAVVHHRAGHPLFVEAHTILLKGGRRLAILRDQAEPVSAMGAIQRESARDYPTRRPHTLCLISADRNGKITGWNRLATHMFGYTAEEALGMELALLVPPGRRGEHERAFRRRLADALRQDYAQSLSVSARRKDGTEFPVDIVMGMTRRGDGSSLDAIIRDRTEDRHLIDQLHDALQRMRFHIERMPLAYIVWDVEFRAVEWNPAAERMFGYSAREAIGKAATELVVPKDVAPHVDQVWSRLLAGDSSSHSLNENVRRDGSQITCEWFNTSLTDASGKVYGVASMAVDITERRALEAQIRNTQKIESLGVLASGVAHDFNSLLMIMLGNTALLRSLKGLPDHARDHLTLIEDSGFRAKELINHLLAYARTGRHNPQPADLNRIIRDAANLIRSSVGKAHLLKLQLAPGLPSVFADHSQVEQIILNLCINAKQAMPDGGTIIVRTRKTKLTPQLLARCAPNDASPGVFAELSVADTGCGLDAETAARVFDPFFTTKPEGRGLGLAAGLGILRQHKGAILVESQVGKGTTMRVFFPLPEPESPRQARAAPTRT